MRAHLAAAISAAALASGCYATTGVGFSAGYVAPAPVYPTTTVAVDAYGPDLVDLGGGVQVIADYDEPVFYSDNFYWRFYGGTWYRSTVYTGGWTVYRDVPYSVRRIDRPYAYVRYRPSGYVPRSQRGPYVRDHRRGGYDGSPGYRQPVAPVVRDHRDPYGRRAPAPAPYQPYQPAPVVRDHREPYRQPAPAPYQPAPAPVVRDHRGTPAASPPREAPPPAPAPVVRDHRGASVASPPREAPPPAPAPVVRDHRGRR
jgi:hypothetical protein